MKGRRPVSHGSGRTWPAYAAAVWAVAFGCLSFYWAAGGGLGLGTLAQAIREPVLSGDPGFILLVWVTGVLKVAAALLPLALVRHWHLGVPDRLLRAAAWVVGVLLTLYGGAGILNGALARLGVFHAADEPALGWYLVLWGPVWLTGGLLFLASAWSTRDAGAGAA